jgi:hypothetical protein
MRREGANGANEAAKNNKREIRAMWRTLGSKLLRFHWLD